MRYFIAIKAANGEDMFVNPDHVQYFYPSIDEAGTTFWYIHYRETPALESFKFYGDITPLIEAIRKDPFTYSIPIEAILKPEPIPPF